MARVEIPEVAWQRTDDNRLAPAGSAQVTVNERDGTPATVYISAAGSALPTNVVVADPLGRVEGWVDEGSYTLLVALGDQSYVQQFEAVSGDTVVSAASTQAVLASSSWNGLVFLVPAPTGVAATDTAAINAALTAAAAAGGGIVLLRTGTYVVNTAIALPVMFTGALTLRGAGVGATKISFTGAVAGSYAFNLGGGSPATVTRWTYIEDLTVVGNANVEGGVLFNGALFCGLRRMRVEGFTGAGSSCVRIKSDAVQQFSNYYNKIESCDIRDSPTGITLEGEDTAGTGANSNLVTNCQFGSHSTAGVTIWRGDTNRIEYCEFDGSTVVGVLLQGNSIYNILYANQFDMPGATNGCVIADSAVQKTRLLHNTGGEWTVSDAGTGTYREDCMATALPTIASASAIAIRGAGNNDTYLVSGTTTITSVTAQWAGRRVKLIFTSTAQMTDGSNLKLAGNFTGGADRSITLDCDGTNWIEAGRSAN